jgi:hypothetical protein
MTNDEKQMLEFEVTMKRAPGYSDLRFPHP